MVTPLRGYEFNSDLVRGLFESQLFNDRLAGRFWHFLAAVIREGGLVTV